MALSSSRYEAIINNYAQTRRKNLRILDKRKAEVYSRIPEYEELDRAIHSLTREYGLKAINNNTGILEEFRKKIEDIGEKKKELLREGGFPEDYLKPIYECRDCMDTGFIDGEKCHCLKQAIVDELYRQSNISEILKRENFSTLSLDYYFDSELDQMKGYIKECKDFVKDFDEKYENILFYGKPGVGKTFFSNCIANELINNGHLVIYFTSTGLFDTLAAYTFRNTDPSDDVINLREDILTCDLLIIDDLGTETTNKFVISQLFLIINERYIRRRSTIISTNLTISELSETYEERIISRIIGSYNLINPQISDIRIKMRKDML